MSNSKSCMNCGTTGPTKFHSLKDKKWEEAENNSLIKVTWKKGGILCHNCYMNFVENQLQRGTKRVKVSVEAEEVEVTTMEEVTKKDVGTTTEDMGEVSMIDLVKTIEAMTRVFYEREHVKKDTSIYLYDELREVFQTNKSVENFLDQLDLIARPLERNKQTMDHSVGTTNEGLNTMASLGVTMTARAVDRKKKQVADAHEKYVENAFLKHSEKAFVLNIDDYHNIHVPQQSDSTSTSILAHMTTILTNPCSISSISQPMQEYLENYVIPIVADWPGQFFICKAIAHRVLLNNEIIPPFVTSFLPMMGPLHVSLNGRELVYKMNSFLFIDIYKGIFGKKKNLGKKPRPWRIDLILYIMRMVWLDISDIVYSKFGRSCKNIEFLYLTDLLSNLIPLVLDVYAVHHREDIFYWMEISHPMIDMITTHLASLSDSPVEIAHSIIRRRTPKFFTADKLQKEARFIFKKRENNTFRQHFVNSVKYPYSPKQLHMLSQKCAILLLETFAKIYQACHMYPLIINSFDGINTYKLHSLGYDITDRHLPRGFVTTRKPFTTILCDYLYCSCTNYTNFSNDEYLRDEVKKNVNAIKESITNKLGENEFIEERNEDMVEDDSDADTTTDDAAITANLFKNTKQLFLQL
ncbi:hypothetical protein C2G38_2213909 [Gigaspora rosea]|uniref:Uncharacterized protein n=1 Tax=Gigaspora rosea TaxID=44941 RepID=A0A397UBH1_9GLOM|nr:hypothetical protein C2G38_2213909 [Gigaspora rosea]